MYTSFLRLLAGNKFSTLSICFFFFFFQWRLERRCSLQFYVRGWSRQAHGDGTQFSCHYTVRVETDGGVGNGEETIRFLLDSNFT